MFANVVSIMLNERFYFLYFNVKIVLGLWAELTGIDTVAVHQCFKV